MNRRLIYGLAAGAAALLVAAVVLVPLLVPTDAIRHEIESRVSDATGRAFRIHGGLSFSLIPVVGLDARDVTLANAPGGHASDLVRIGRMQIAVRLWPLLSGKIEAREIDLDRPVIALEVAHDGKANWELAPRRKTGGGGIKVPSQTTFAGVTITGATVTYDNAKLDIHRALDDLDARVTITRLGLPAGVAGAFGMRGRRLDYTAKIGTPQSLLDGRATNVDVALSADFLHAGFIGFLSSDGTAKGSISLRTPSAKDVAAWLGHPVSAGSGLGPFAMLANLAARDRRIVLSGIQAKLDGMSLNGTLTADTQGKVPLVTATLNADRLDLNTYLVAGAKPGGGAPHGPPGGGWSRTPFRLDLIKLVNGHLTLNLGALSVLHLKIAKTTLAVALQDGLMTAHLAPMELYGGAGNADLSVDDRGPMPAIASRLTFSGIAMRPFLADTIGVDHLDGRGAISLDIAAKGGSPDAIMRSLSGKGAVAIGHGSVSGVDMGRVARSIAAILSAGAVGQSAATPFDRFGGSFTISNGILSNRDLKLDSAFLHMAGAGSLDLGNQTIAYRIEPKAALGGRLDLLDIGVPFVITGPWSHVQYKPDIAGAVSGLVGSVLEKGAAPLGSLLQGLTGHGQPPAKKKSKSTGDRLKSLFGLH